jgi:nicotinamidase/pyrazinamidase
MLIIDPQKDFMPGGPLGVPGADEDMKRLAYLIDNRSDEIDNIIVTLDSHHTVHVAHPIWWVDQEGNNPEPFTTISSDDLVGDNPKWKCALEDFQHMTEFYMNTLKEKGSVHVVWPPHCIIGSEGHGIEETLFKSLTKWEQDFKVVEYVNKGSNLYVEHFGAFEAELPIAGYEDTTFNVELFEVLKKHDRIIIAGEASSHCVAKTLLQMMEKMTEEEIKKIIYLEDACSPVTGFEDSEKEFIQALVEAGVTVTNTKDITLG